MTHAKNTYFQFKIPAEEKQAAMKRAGDLGLSLTKYIKRLMAEDMAWAERFNGESIFINKEA